MNTRALQKTQTAFRLNSDLVHRLKAQAKKENRSLSNYVECILLNAVHKEPNETTLAAIREAKQGKFAGTIDTSNMEAFIKSCEE